MQRFINGSLPFLTLKAKGICLSQLQDSVYGGLVMETRLKSYLDAVSLNLNTNGINMDFSGPGPGAVAGKLDRYTGAIEEFFSCC